MKRPMKFERDAESRDETDIFYIDSIKFVTLTKASTANGIFVKEDLASVKEFFSILEENGQQSCIVEYNKNYFSFWNSGDKYFVFHPMSFCHKSPKCVEFLSFDCVQKYLVLIFAESQAEYTFHSVDILKVNNQVLSSEKILNDYYQELSGMASPKQVTFPEEVSLNNSPHKMCLLPNAQHIIDTTSSYERLTEYKDVLRCPNSIDRVSLLNVTLHPFDV